MMMDLMVAMLMMAIAMGPMMDSFFPSFNAMAHERRTAVMAAGAMGTLNLLAGLPYATLETHTGAPANLSALLGSAAAAKEAIKFNRHDYMPVVTIIDASSGAGGLLKITVTLDTIAFQTLKAER
jgi:hypothetical protein